MNDLKADWKYVPPLGKFIIYFLIAIGCVLVLLMLTSMIRAVYTPESEQSVKVTPVKEKKTDSIKLIRLNDRRDGLPVYKFWHAGHLFLMQYSGSIVHHPACPCMKKTDEQMMQKVMDDFSNYLKNRGVGKDE